MSGRVAPMGSAVGIAYIAAPRPELVFVYVTCIQ